MNIEPNNDVLLAIYKDLWWQVVDFCHDKADKADKGYAQLKDDISWMMGSFENWNHTKKHDWLDIHKGDSLEEWVVGEVTKWINLGCPALKQKEKKEWMA